MVNQLRDDFELPTYQINFNDKYDIETLGKGRIRQPKTSELFSFDLLILFHYF